MPIEGYKCEPFRRLQMKGGKTVNYTTPKLQGFSAINVIQDSTGTIVKFQDPLDNQTPQQPSDPAYQVDE